MGEIMKLKRIILITLLLLAILTIGAVSAADNNATNEFVSVEKSDEISVMEDNNTLISVCGNDSEILNAEDNNTVISVNGNDSECLSAEDNNTVISVSGNDSEILNVENSNDIVSVSNDNDLTSYSPFAIEPQMTQHKTQYKTVYLGKMVFSKKYKKMALYGYKVPSKKNKKAWKKHVAYQKAFNKQLKQLLKTAKKVVYKSKANHWHTMGDIYYKIKYSRNCIGVLYYVNCYRTYNYNPLLNKSWWD